MSFFNKRCNSTNCYNNDYNCNYDNCCQCDLPDIICPTGAPVVTGPTGATGATGATGTNGLSEYAYIYNTDAQVVPIEADISYSSNGTSWRNSNKFKCVNTNPKNK